MFAERHETLHCKLVRAQAGRSLDGMLKASSVQQLGERLCCCLQGCAALLQLLDVDDVDAGHVLVCNCNVGGKSDAGRLQGFSATSKRT